MIVRSLFNCGLAVAVCFAFSHSLTAQVFFTEDFDYPDGDLTTMSGGLWVNHSGNPPDIQVSGGSAVVTAPGSADDNRQTGFTMGDTDTWYYAVRFSVAQATSGAGVNNDYFIHFRPEGFDFRGRLATQSPAAAGDFTLQIWAASFGDGMTDWNGDFSFGDELTAVVCWENETATATLWVNPVDMNSTSISHQSLQDEDPKDGVLDDAMVPITSLALRQDSTDGSIVTIPICAIGDDFDAVLAALDATGKCDNPLGDVNLDGNVDLLDVPAFVDALTTGSDQCEADIDQSGSVDLLDVPPFVTLLGG